MHGWLGVVEVLMLLVVLSILALGLLALRQRWLSRMGGTFECSLRSPASPPGAGWVFGVARYQEGLLQWFRFFSYAIRPRAVFTRDDVRVLDSREAHASEVVSLGTGQRIVCIGTQPAITEGSSRGGSSPAAGWAETTGESGGRWELAMNSDSLTGLLSWLEAAPPGLHTHD